MEEKDFRALLDTKEYEFLKSALIKSLEYEEKEDI